MFGEARMLWKAIRAPMLRWWRLQGLRYLIAALAARSVNLAIEAPYLAQSGFEAVERVMPTGLATLSIALYASEAFLLTAAVVLAVQRMEVILAEPQPGRPLPPSLRSRFLLSLLEAVPAVATLMGLDLVLMLQREYARACGLSGFGLAFGKFLGNLDLEAVFAALIWPQAFVVGLLWLLGLMATAPRDKLAAWGLPVALLVGRVVDAPIYLLELADGKSQATGHQYLATAYLCSVCLLAAIFEARRLGKVKLARGGLWLVCISLAARESLYDLYTMLPGTWTRAAARLAAFPVAALRRIPWDSEQLTDWYYAALPRPHHLPYMAMAVWCASTLAGLAVVFTIIWWLLRPLPLRPPATREYLSAAPL